MTARQFLKRSLSRNVAVKALAVALALLLWVHVATDKEYEVEAHLPVTSVSHARNLALTEPPPDTIVALVAATGKSLLRSGWRSAGVTVRLDQMQIGQRDIRFSAANVAIVQPEGIEFRGIVRPLHYRFTLDRIESKAIPVVSRVTVHPAPGFTVGSGEAVSPREVIASGPRSSLQRYSRVYTETKELFDVRTDFDLSLRIDSAGAYGIEFDPPAVTYHVVVTVVRERSFESIPVALFNPPEGPYELIPETVSLIISGPEREINQIDRGQISVSADFRRRDATGRTTLQVSLPSRLSLVNISDSLALVRFSGPDSL
ncbi:MAG: hypothetical protein ACE5GA_03765 [Candidatus Zixiibacteriota bacterium]